VLFAKEHLGRSESFTQELQYLVFYQFE
jgi:hypothetical protein